MVCSLRALVVLCTVASVSPAVALAESDDKAWYLVRGSSGSCAQFNGDPTALTKQLQQQPGGVLNDGHGGSVADKSEVAGVIERVVNDGKGHIGGMVFVQGADACQRVAETMRTTHLMPYQQRVRALHGDETGK